VSLEFFPPEPAPPTYQEMAEAVLAWRLQMRNGVAPYLPTLSGAAGDLYMLAERLVAVRRANASRCSLAPNLGAEGQK
jgi:hypothetical protein